jgi:Domain of unknown function (DUF1835)
MKTLHITNGSSLTNYLRDLKITGDILTWQEMLCEGPTLKELDSDVFINARKSFLNTTYNIEIDIEEYEKEIEKLNYTQSYSQIVLWFEYDLFCHINMIAVISLILQKKIILPIYLVCSGRVKTSKDLKGLSELSSEQLQQHYKDKVLLSIEDLELAKTIWDIYCGKDHNLLKPFIVTSSSFKYMSNCLKAHLKRFPDSKNGLSVLEQNILDIVKSNAIKSKHHLLGYALNYQGYYGYGDTQFERMIENLSIFFFEDENSITLNRKGHDALMDQHNFAETVNNDIYLGGVNRLDFQFDKLQNKLVKSHSTTHKSI